MSSWIVRYTVEMYQFARPALQSIVSEIVLKYVISIKNILNIF